MIDDQRCSKCNKCIKTKKDRNVVPNIKQNPKVRQHLVYNVDEDNHWEPYMFPLKKLFSEDSIACDSNIELPWKYFAIPSRIKLRRQMIENDYEESFQTETETETENQMPEVSNNISDPNVKLPWQTLIITKTVPIQEHKPDKKNKFKIPWDDLILQTPMEIKPISDAEKCLSNDIEMPWHNILISPNIIIKPEKIKATQSFGTTKSCTSKRRRTCCLKQRIN